MIKFIVATATLFHSIHPTSVTDFLAYYHLYPETRLGKKALQNAWALLDPDHLIENPTDLPIGDIENLISLIATENSSKITLTPDQLTILDTLSKQLKHHTLKGHKATTPEEVKALPPEEVDIARSLLLHELPLEELVNYEAMLDLLALQVIARLPKNYTSLDMIQEINHLIFFELEFRFPPHSLYAADIDTYTFLPSVMDSRQGVCLGVSIIYLALGQRLGLPLEAVTPPGHIYVRHKNRNIETTARGIHVPDDSYLSLHTKHLQVRNNKEVVGCAFQNKGAAMWYKERYQDAVEAFETAKIYLPEDHLINMLLGYNYLFVGKINEGTALLKKVAGKTLDGGVHADTAPIDFLEGHIDVEGLRILYKEVDETRASIEAKKVELEAIVKKWPKFREGLFHLAVCHLQLGRSKEGLETLTRYHALDPNHPIAEYYLSILSLERYRYVDAKRYYQNCEKLLSAAGHEPKTLKHLRKHLTMLSI